MKHSQQQVLLVNNLRVLHPCLKHGEFQYVACLLVEVKFSRCESLLLVVLFYLLHERLFHVIHINVHDGEEVLHGAVLFP